MEIWKRRRKEENEKFLLQTEKFPLFPKIFQGGALLDSPRFLFWMAG